MARSRPSELRSVGAFIVISRRRFDCRCSYLADAEQHSAYSDRSTGVLHDSREVHALHYKTDADSGQVQKDRGENEAEGVRHGRGGCRDLCTVGITMEERKK